MMRTLQNGCYTTYAYNPVGMLTSLTNSGAFGQTLSSFSNFGYDGVFNLKNVTASVPGAPSYGGTNTWAYDTKDRLLSDASTKLGGWSFAFGYDPAGNPTTFKGVSQLFNADNQRNAAGFVFDGNGNPTTYAGVGMAYDVENRLTGSGRPGPPATGRTA